MNGSGGLAEVISDNIGGSDIGFVSNKCCDNPGKDRIVKRLECYCEQIKNIRTRRAKANNTSRLRTINRKVEEEGLIKKIRYLLSLHSWLKTDYAHLIPDGIIQPPS